MRLISVEGQPAFGAIGALMPARCAACWPFWRRDADGHHCRPAQAPNNLGLHRRVTSRHGLWSARSPMGGDLLHGAAALGAACRVPHAATPSSCSSSPSPPSRS